MPPSHRTLAIADVLTPPVAIIIGLVVSAMQAQRVYVDEPGLLAGFWDMRDATNSFTPGPKYDDRVAKSAVATDHLLRRFEHLGIGATLYTTHAGSNCSCTAVAGVVHAPTSDAHALLLTVEVGEAPDLSDARESRAHVRDRG